MIGCGGVARPESELGTCDDAGALVFGAVDGAAELDVEVGVLPLVVGTVLDALVLLLLVVSAVFGSFPFSVVDEGGGPEPFDTDDE